MIAVKQSQKVAAIDAAISAMGSEPLSTDAVVTFAASDATSHLFDIRGRCSESKPEELMTFIAIHFLTIGLAAGLAVQESAQLESL